MGNAYTGLNEFEKAVEAYEKANKIEPNEDVYSYIVISLIIRLNLNGFFISLNCLIKLTFIKILITF
jgi:tetratricopeptide (TPR) repeat protein